MRGNLISLTRKFSPDSLTASRNTLGFLSKINQPLSRIGKALRFIVTLTTLIGSSLIWEACNLFDLIDNKPDVIDLMPRDGGKDLADSRPTDFKKSDLFDAALADTDVLKSDIPDAADAFPLEAGPDGLDAKLDGPKMDSIVDTGPICNKKTFEDPDKTLKTWKSTNMSNLDPNSFSFPALILKPSVTSGAYISPAIDTGTINNDFGKGAYLTITADTYPPLDSSAITSLLIETCTRNTTSSCTTWTPLGSKNEIMSGQEQVLEVRFTFSTTNTSFSPRLLKYIVNYCTF